MSNWLPMLGRASTTIELDGLEQRKEKEWLKGLAGYRMGISQKRSLARQKVRLNTVIDDEVLLIQADLVACVIASVINPIHIRTDQKTYTTYDRKW